jgi:hypothetical protein
VAQLDSASASEALSALHFKGIHLPCPFRRPQLFSCRLMREAGAISTQEVVDGEQAARCGEESILA